MTTVHDPAFRPHPFAQSNVGFLQQGHDLLAELSDADYVRSFPPGFADGIGAHLRHVVDHYTSFLDGLAAGRIDYDARRRDRRIATDRTAAAAAIRGLIERLWRIAGSDPARRLDVVMDCGGSAADAGICSRSSVERELQFLVSHTVHHYALVAVMLRLAGREPAPGFGVSPSTLRHVQAFL